MTEEEAKRIEDCMDKPEFLDLLKEYVNDISDPKNMEEYDQYIRQLEEEGEIPADEEIIRPEKGFVIKTTALDLKSKIFINCAGTSKVPAATQRTESAPKAPGFTGDPGKGTHWSIPYIFTSCRMDQDKNKEPCHVYDILFSTDTLKMAEKDARFKALVTQTSLETVEEAGKLKLRESKQSTFSFSILKNMKYKGEVVRPHRMKKEGDQNTKNDKHYSSKTTTTTQSSAPHLQQKAAAQQKQPEDPTKPKVTLIHRGEMAMEQCLQTYGRLGAPISSRPKQLIVKIELPLMMSAADLDLETKGGYIEIEVRPHKSCHAKAIRWYFIKFISCNLSSHQPCANVLRQFLLFAGAWDILDEAQASFSCQRIHGRCQVQQDTEASDRDAGRDAVAARGDCRGGTAAGARVGSLASTA